MGGVKVGESFAVVAVDGDVEQGIEDSLRGRDFALGDGDVFPFQFEFRIVGEKVFDELGAGEPDFLPVFERHVPRPNLISRSEGGRGCGQSTSVEEAQDKSRGGPEKSEG